MNVLLIFSRVAIIDISGVLNFFDLVRESFIQHLYRVKFNYFLKFRI